MRGASVGVAVADADGQWKCGVRHRSCAASSASESEKSVIESHLSVRLEGKFEEGVENLEGNSTLEWLLPAIWVLCLGHPENWDVLARVRLKDPTEPGTRMQ